MIFSRRKNKLDLNLQKTRQSLLRVAFAWCNNETLAEDLVHEALTKALKNQHQINDPTKSEAWIFKILNNCWLEYLRKSRPSENIDDMFIVDPRNTEQQTEQLQIVDKVRHAVAQLPNAQRQVVTLVDLKGFSYNEVASILDIPAGTVMSRLNRARATLKQKLIHYQPESTDKNTRPSSGSLRAVK